MLNPEGAMRVAPLQDMPVLLEAVGASSLGTRSSAREVPVAVEGARGTLRWIVTRATVFNCDRIHAWMEYTNPNLCSKPLATIDVALDECTIVRDGLGLPRVSFGAVSFFAAEHLAVLLHQRFGIQAVWEG